MTKKRLEKKSYAGCYSIAYAGVELVSRYGKRREFEDMMRAVDFLHKHAPRLAALVVVLECDSQMGACYGAAVVSAAGAYPTAEEARAVASVLGAAFRKIHGGHNGITILCGRDQIHFADPCWCDGE